MRSPVEKSPRRGAGLEWLLRIALAMSSLLLSLLVIEVGLRVHAWYEDREVDAFRNLRPVALVHDPATRARTRDIIRLNKNPRIIYELIPCLTANYRDQIIEINSAGFRSPHVALEKPPGTIRIAGLGDSVMFGWGVRQDEFYLALLARMIEERSPGIRCDWLNSGVPGYNTAIQVETLRAKLLDYQPDVVILGYVKNDLQLPNFIRTKRPLLSPTKSYLEAFIRSAKKRLAQVPDHRLVSSRDVRDRVPEEYRDMVGIEGFRAAMTEFRQMEREYGFHALVFTHRDLPPEVRAVCEELDLPVLEGEGALRRYMQEHDIEQYLGSPLTISDHDPHPTALSHRILAGVLYEDLERNGVLESLRAEALARAADLPSVAAARSDRDRPRAPAAAVPVQCPAPD